MSINIDQHQLPDTAFLEQLANHFFSEGSDPHFSESSGPPSVAGVGATQSAIQQNNNVNFEDPQTSFPDKNLQSGTKNIDSWGFQQTAINNSGFPDLGISENMISDLGIVYPGVPDLGLLKEPSVIGSAIPGSAFSGSSNPGSFVSSAGPAGFTPIFEEIPSFYFLPDFKSGGQYDQPLFNEPRAGAEKIPGPALRPWGFDFNVVKQDFPILAERVNGKPIIWLDNAATTQKPRQVIERLSFFYEHENSNIHRAAHELAARATDAYEEARKRIQTFIGAGSPNEIIFVRGTTEAINLVAKSWGEQHLVEGDEIILTHLEHHANIVPWQQLANKKGLKIRVIPVDDDGQVILSEYAKLLNSKTKLVSFTQVSNALGTVTPAKTIIEMAKAAGAKVLLDGAQSVSHLKVDVRQLDVDWFVFSGHKIFGPTGIGVVYGKEDLLNATEPWQGGGNMIKDVTFEKTQYHNSPSRFEAGTGNIADAVGLGAAIEYVSRLGIENIYLYEHYLLEYATRLLKNVPGLQLIGTAPDKTSVLSFVLKGYTNDEVGQALNQEGIAVRTGHHCAQPILRRFGLESTVRPSLAFYNTCADIDTLVATLHRLKSRN